MQKHIVFGLLITAIAGVAAGLLFATSLVAFGVLLGISIAPLFYSVYQGISKHIAKSKDSNAAVDKSLGTKVNNTKALLSTKEKEERLKELTQKTNTTATPANITNHMEKFRKSINTEVDNDPQLMEYIQKKIDISEEEYAIYGLLITATASVVAGLLFTTSPVAFGVLLAVGITPFCYSVYKVISTYIANSRSVVVDRSQNPGATDPLTQKKVELLNSVKETTPLPPGQVSQNKEEGKEPAKKKTAPDGPPIEPQSYKM